jgi:DNA-binding NtrC family response regulator
MILIVDDELENRESLSEVLEQNGWPCLKAESAEEGLKKLRENDNIKLLITDLRMPGGMDGIAFLEAARFVRPEVARLLVTAYGTIEDTVQAMRLGAFDVLPKPLKIKNLKESVERLLSRGTAPAPFKSLISQSFSKVLDILRRASNSDANVLFTGESGTGKTHLAKTLHQWSSRAQAPFMNLNCASFPRDLIESELFGFEKGAFTGATSTHMGRIQAADHGTILLDEIGDLDIKLQAKLLQFIQEKKFFRLGNSKEIFADVRILAATNQPLDDRVKDGHFREDLLYRLKVVEVEIPPLRNRKEDLLWLVPTLLDGLSEKNKYPRVRFTFEGMQALVNYNWPGNIRELENVLESTLVLATPEKIREGFLDKGDLPEKMTKKNLENLGGIQTSNSPAFSFQGLPDLATLEKQAIEQALVLTGGNKKQTARILGVSERTLYRILDPKEPF